MYNVSQAYKTALSKPYKVRKIAGTIGSTSFGDDNIAQGSLIIDNKCTEGNEVKIGTVYMAQLTCTFRNINLTGQWSKKQITIREGLMLSDQSFEYVPMGVFTVYEANHQEDGVSVTAYDNMKRTDKKFKLSTTTGTPYDYMLMISTDCGVALAQTKEQIRSLPNGTQAMVLYAENDIETYRDLLAWVAQAVGCFATIDREGKLELRQYGTEPVDTIGATTRWLGASFSDFETYYTGVSVVRMEDESTYYRGLDEDDGLTYNLGSNPLLQMQSLDTVLDAILGSLQRIHYTPFSFSRSCCPAYDLGDVVEFEDGNGEGKVGCIMSYEYKYHGAYTMQGFGSNPALANVRSKTDKQISGLMSRESVSGIIQFYNFTNLQQITLHDDYKEIIFIRFGSLKQTMVTFQAEIKLTATDLEEAEKIIGTVKYVFNGVEMNYKPVETWIDGVHLLHLLYFFQIDSSRINTLSVRMKTDQEIVIAAQDIYACVSGQGLVASDTWDGYIDVEETIAEILPFATEPPAVAALTDTPTIALQNIIEINATEQMEPSALANEPQVVGFDDGAYINKYPLHALTWGTVQGYEWTEDGIYNMDETNPKYYAW